MDKIKNVFKPSPLVCGGEGVIEIALNNKTVSKIFYRLPTSDEKLDYVYQFQSGLGAQLQLKEIKDAKDKAKKCHEVLIRDLSIPFAKKVFTGARGFIDANGELIENKPINDQFELIKTYWSHVLTDLVAIAYATEGTVKKKF